MYGHLQNDTLEYAVFRGVDVSISDGLELPQIYCCFREKPCYTIINNNKVNRNVFPEEIQF